MKKKRKKRSWKWNWKYVREWVRKYTRLSPWHDKAINRCVWILIAFGTAMIISTAMGQGNADVSPFSAVMSAVRKQVIFVLVAYFFMVLFSYLRLDTIQFLQYRWVWAFLCLVYFAAMAYALTRPAIGGSRAWIYVLGISVQPSEFGKPLLILLCANSALRSRDNPNMQKSLWQLFAFPIVMLLVDALLLAAQKDMGTMIITGLILFCCMLIPSGLQYRSGQRYLKIAFGLIFAGGLALIFASRATGLLYYNDFTYHIAQRIDNVFNPYTDVYETGYQPANALYGIADAHFFGKGYGNSARKYGYLTQAESDYILAVTVEETGIFGLTLITVCYGIIVIQLSRYAARTRSLPYRLTLMGTASYLMLHFIINVGGVGGFIPMTGVPLLFISAGGSSLMAISIAVGASQHCIADIREKEAEKEKEHESRILRVL